MSRMRPSTSRIWVRATRPTFPGTRSSAADRHRPDVLTLVLRSAVEAVGVVGFERVTSEPEAATVVVGGTTWMTLR